jgi:hypothetical protein
MVFLLSVEAVDDPMLVDWHAAAVKAIAVPAVTSFIRLDSELEIFSLGIS